MDVGAAEAAFRERIKREEKRRRDTTDSEYWCCLVFQSRAQKNDFLNSTGWIRDGNKYIDGRFVAKKLGIRLQD